MAFKRNDEYLTGKLNTIKIRRMTRKTKTKRVGARNRNDNLIYEKIRCMYCGERLR